MILRAFTLFHVLLSLAGIASGFIVLYDLLTSKWSDRWTNFFLLTTAATSVTGFLFPFHGVTPGIVVGILSLIVLGIATLALYRRHLLGSWRRTYVITAIIALYFNVFVLIAQLFQKVPALKALAPTGSEPPFQITQVVVLLAFLVMGIRATMKFHLEPLRMAKGAGQ